MPTQCQDVKNALGFFFKSGPAMLSLVATSHNDYRLRGELDTVVADLKVLIHESLTNGREQSESSGDSDGGGGEREVGQSFLCRRPGIHETHSRRSRIRPPRGEWHKRRAHPDQLFSRNKGKHYGDGSTRLCFLWRTTSATRRSKTAGFAAVASQTQGPSKALPLPLYSPVAFGSGVGRGFHVASFTATGWRPQWRVIGRQGRRGKLNPNSDTIDLAAQLSFY